MCKSKAEACHSNPAQRLISLLTRANVSVSKRPVNTAEKPQKMCAPFLLHLDVRWQSCSTLKHYNTQTSTAYYSTARVHLGSGWCSNSYIQRSCFFPALYAWKMCPNNCTSLCDPVLPLSGRYSLTESSTHEKCRYICQGPLPRNHSDHVRAELWWGHSSPWERAEMDISE